MRFETPFSDTFTFREVYKRFRFAMNRSGYMDLIQDIKNDNTTLQRLAEQTRTLHVRRHLSHMPNFATIRSGATSVFESLQNALHVSCTLTHKASICLGLSTDPSHPQIDPSNDALSLSFESCCTTSLSIPNRSPQFGPSRKPRFGRCESNRQWDVNYRVSLFYHRRL
jgi:hypothetical protein